MTVAPPIGPGIEDRSLRLAVLQTRAAGDGGTIEACRRCTLCEQRKKVVFGVGDATAKIMLVGEGPGQKEDELGEPFVGRAGLLLDEMLAAMHLRRQDVYIGNTVKCRPPGNREPEAEETEACRPFLTEQIRIVRPWAIVALGGTAARWFFPDISSIIAERGKWRQWSVVGKEPGTQIFFDVMPTFHPAFLLRNALAKPAAWRDLQAVMRHVGIPI